MGYQLQSGDAIQLTTVVRTTLGQNETNVSYWLVGSVLGSGRNLEQAISALSAALAPSIIAAIPDSSAFQGVLGRVASPPDRKSQTFKDVTDADPGALAGDVLPSAVCGLITLKSSNGPPRSGLRHYIPSTTEAQNGASGAPVAGYLTLMGDIGTAMITPVVSSDGGGNSVTLTPVLRHDTLTPRTLDTVEVATNWATLRRRSSKGRPDRPIF